MSINFSRKSDEDLKRDYARNDRWLTYTTADECRRMFLMQEMSAEWERRGLEPEDLYEETKWANREFWHEQEHMG